MPSIALLRPQAYEDNNYFVYVCAVPWEFYRSKLQTVGTFEYLYFARTYPLDS